jgi:hypothetical protein
MQLLLQCMTCEHRIRTCAAGQSPPVMHTHTHTHRPEIITREPPSPPHPAIAGRRKRDMLRLRRPLRSASTLLLFGSARSFSLLGPLSSSRLRPPCNLRVRCQASIPDSEEGWRAVLSPSQFSVLRNAATEPSGYSENKEGELEYKLKTELKTKYPADGAYWYASQRG